MGGRGATHGQLLQAAVAGCVNAQQAFDAVVLAFRAVDLFLPTDQDFKLLIAFFAAKFVDWHFWTLRAKNIGPCQR
jgi:hypothetical protein